MLLCCEPRQFSSKASLMDAVTEARAIIGTAMFAFSHSTVTNEAIISKLSSAFKVYEFSIQFTAGSSSS